MLKQKKLSLLVFFLFFLSLLPLENIAIGEVKFFQASTQCFLGSKVGQIISLEMGDSGGDGHAKTETFLVCSNLNQVAMKKAYQAGTKILGFDFSDEVAAQYDAAPLSKEHIKILTKNKIQIDTTGEAELTGPITLYPVHFASIWLQILKLGNEKFQYGEIKINNSLSIGGYALFE